MTNGRIYSDIKLNKLQMDIIDKLGNVTHPHPKHKEIKSRGMSSPLFIHDEEFKIPLEYLIPASPCSSIDILEYPKEKKEDDKRFNEFLDELYQICFNALELPDDFKKYMMNGDDIGFSLNSICKINSILSNKLKPMPFIKDISKNILYSQYMKDRCNRTRRMIMGSEISDVDFGLRVKRILQNNRNPCIDGRYNNMRDLHKYWINAGMTKSEVKKYGKRKEN